MQAFQWDACDHLWVCRHASYMSGTHNLLWMQNLNPCKDGSEDSNDDIDFNAFAEELGSNWDDKIAYDKTFNCSEFSLISSVNWKQFILNKWCMQPSQSVWSVAHT